MDRVIIHSDANCFYASVEMLYHPEFAGKPLAVGGDAICGGQRPLMRISAAARRSLTATLVRRFR